MSLLPQVNAYHSDGKGQYDYFFALANESAKQWSLYPALSTINVANNNIISTNLFVANSVSTNSLNANYISTTSIALSSQTLTADINGVYANGDPLITSTALGFMSSVKDWAYFPALSTVQMDGNFINNCPKIVMDGNIVTTAGNYILVNAENPVQNWAKFQAASNVDVNSKNINNANQLNFITAVPGPLTTGATINSLNSLNFSLVTAGLFQAGINNVNNIAFWNQSLPVPGANVNLYSKILTYGGGNQIYLATDTYLAVPRLFLGGLLGTAGGMLQIIGDDAVYVTVNTQPCPAAWSRFRATQAVDFNLQQAIGVRGVEFAVAEAGPFNLLTINGAGKLTAEGALVVTSPASADINVNNFGLTNVRDIKFNGAGKLLATNVGGALTYDGQVITTGDAGNAANWAQYPANHNVRIPGDYDFSMNLANTETFYPDCTLNANIYHGVSGSAVAPDFISFPTTFQVGTTVNPAREITMTAGAEGFGINSDTEINIDATLLVNIYSAGPVSIESVTDFNVTASLTTFEIGEFNVAAAATTFEVASFDVVSAGNVFIEGTIATLAFGATTVTTAALGITTAATIIGCASWNLTSAGNVTTLGTQIGFTAGTKFETLSSGDTSLVANGILTTQSLNAINLTAPIVNISNARFSSITASTITTRELNVYNISSVNVNVEAMFALYPGGQINVYDNLAGSGSITAQTELFAPKVRASTIYGSSGATVDGQLFLQTPLVTATNNMRVNNTLYGTDARFTGETTLSSILQFVGQPVTFANGQTNMPNNVTISTLTVQTINGTAYPPPSLYNQSGYIYTDAAQTLTVTPTLFGTLTRTFVASATGFTMITGICSFVGVNAVNWNAYTEIYVNGTGTTQYGFITNTGVGHYAQCTSVYRLTTTAGSTYVLELKVYGSATVNGRAGAGSISYISGLI